MKRTMVVAGVCAAVLVAQSGFAKSLEDILKEKGVITEAEFKEATKVKPVDYKLGEGFTFTSADEKFRGSLGGSMQLRYTFTDKEQGQDTSEFRLRRIKLFLNGYALSKDLTYKLQANFAPSANLGSTLLEETYLNYRLLNEFQVRVGQDKVPFVRQELVSTNAQQFVDRSFVADAFRAGYDIGLALNGKAFDGLLAYSTGLYGGVGQNTLRASNNNAFAARVAVNPFGDMKYTESDQEYSAHPLLSIGASCLLDTLKATRSGNPAVTTLESNNLPFAGSSGWLGSKAGVFTATDKLDVQSYGVDLAFKWLGASLQGEYLLGQADGKDSNRTLRAHGYYAQAGYFVLPKRLDLALRYAWLDPNRDAANDQISELQGAVSYYFNAHNMKLQADVTNRHSQPAKTDDLICRLQAQIVF